jgi:thiamine biosynthesis lipoprotein
MDELWWYLTRSSGVVATVLLVAALVWGLLFSARATGEQRRPAWWLDLHKYLGGLAFAFVIVHLVAVHQDELSGIGLLEILVPFSGDRAPWAVAWGVFATYTLALVVFTSWPRQRGPRRLWWMVHLLSVPSTLLAGVHAWMIGSSRSGLWFQGLLAALAGVAVYATVIRVFAPPRRPRSRPPGVTPARPRSTPSSRAADVAATLPPVPLPVGPGRRSVRAEAHMGTTVSLVAHGASEDAVDAFFARIAHYERLLSRHRPDTELSRLARRELGIDDVSPPVREVLRRCQRLRRATQGSYDHLPRHRSGDPADPVIDADGFAKGWIVDQAARRLARDGVTSFSVSAGGDVVTAAPPPDRPGWRVGVRHPEDAGAVLAVLEVERAAVATSGAYERGDHIRGHGAGRLASVTVLGPDLAVADGLATAVHASGRPRPQWWAEVGRGYALMTASTDGRLRWTSNLDAYLVAPAPAEGRPAPRPEVVPAGT